MNGETKIRLYSDALRFSATHFLVDMGKCERLHGHTYGVTVELGGQPGADKTIVDFNWINPVVAAILDRFDHKVLLAGEDERLRMKTDGGEIEIRFKNKRFVFPASDCVTLPLPAITAESLAVYLCALLAPPIREKASAVVWIEVGVAEGGAQMALHRRSINQPD